ncbi:MAG TPA: OB-fold domain-containing protein [Candidatus Binatia bacterium]|nr:OB-fold domain-containing protein [Candidatus Binatia bacterium]
MVDYLKPLPVLDIEGRFFWESCKKHEMALQQCVSCKQFRYPPRSLCPRCHSPEAQWTPISGRGQVYVALVMCHSYSPAWEHDMPYNISLIDLEEGVRMWSNVIGCLAEEVKIGYHVEISYDDVNDDITLPKFRKA